MISIIDGLEARWASGAIVLDDYEDVLASSVLHGIPDAASSLPEPLLIGPGSPQSNFFDTTNVYRFREILATHLPSIASAARKCHVKISMEWKPDVAHGAIAAPSLGRNSLVRYRRIVLPVWTSLGAPLLITRTELLTIH